MVSPRVTLAVTHKSKLRKQDIDAFVDRRLGNTPLPGPKYVQILIHMLSSTKVLKKGDIMAKYTINIYRNIDTYLTILIEIYKSMILYYIYKKDISTIF